VVLLLNVRKRYKPPFPAAAAYQDKDPTIAALWEIVAKIRNRNGDKEGARRARNNATIKRGMPKPL
jgi:hypothetical protein